MGRPFELTYPFYNLKASNTTALKAALANNTRAWIGCLGDSLTQGLGTGDPSDSTGAPGGRIKLSWPYLLKGLLNAGIRATKCNARIGNGIIPTTGVNLYDARITIGTGSTNQITAGAAGREFSCTANPSTIVYTPDDSFDRVRWFPHDNTVAGTIVLQDFAGSTFDTWAATLANAKLVVRDATPAAATSALRMTRTASSGGHAAGWFPYLAASSALEIVPLGWGGSKASDWIATSSDITCGTSLAIIAPSLAHGFICLGTNDIIALQNPTSTIKPNIKAAAQILITAGCGVTLITFPPEDPTANAQLTKAAQDAVAAVILQICDELDISCIDMYNAFGGLYANVQGPVGRVDGVHWPKYDIWAKYVYRYCQQVLVAA